jgi:hypothetical protein
MFKENNMSSEAQRDLPHQPNDTCPMIDSVIDSLGAIKKYMKKYDRIDDVATLHSMLYDIEWDLDLDGDIEKIRTNVCLIRDWGSELEGICFTA